MSDLGEEAWWSVRSHSGAGFDGERGDYEIEIGSGGRSTPPRDSTCLEQGGRDATLTGDTVVAFPFYGV